MQTDLEIINLNTTYETIIKPDNLCKNIQEVEEFIKGSKKEDLIWFLRACEDAELYEYCKYLKTIIDEQIT